MPAAIRSWRRQEASSPRAFGGSTALPTPGFQSSDLQNCERINSCRLSSQFTVLWYSISRKLILKFTRNQVLCSLLMCPSHKWPRAGQPAEVPAVIGDTHMMPLCDPLWGRGHTVQWRITYYTSAQASQGLVGQGAVSRWELMGLKWQA